jgi:hypothetical protein
MPVITTEVVHYAETGGTATIVEADDLLVVLDQQWTAEGANVVRSDARTGYQPAAGVVAAQRYWSITTEGELYMPTVTSSGTWAGWHWYDLLLSVPCQIATDFSADTVTITPPLGLASNRGSSGNYDVATLERRERNGNTYRAQNVISALTGIEIEAGNRVTMAWEHWGDYAQPAATASYSPPASTLTPIVSRSVSVSITPEGDSALTLPCQASVSWQSGLVGEVRPCIGNANAFGGAVVRLDPDAMTLQIVITVNPETSLPVWDDWTDLQAAAIVVTINDGTTTMTLTMPRCLLVEAPTVQDQGGELVYTLSYIQTQADPAAPAWTLQFAANTPA